MNARTEAEKLPQDRKRPMYGSVWLALFGLLRDGAERPLSRDGNPSPRP